MIWKNFGETTTEAEPFNITVVQTYAPISDYDDNETDEFYDQLQNVINQMPTTMLMKSGKAFADPPAMMTQMREDSDSWSLPPLIILCC